MYEVSDSGISWKGRKLEAAADTFEVLNRIIAVDQHTVFVLGKPFDAHRASFRVLSESYAADTERVYSILETKLKPLKQADPGSFRALHDRFGLDDHNAFYREKRLRGVSLRSFRALGPDHAIDEKHLHCGIEKLKVPDGIDIARARLRTLVDHWNPPQIAFALTDGTKTWVNVFSLAHDWCVCEGADFDQLRMLGDLYHADHHRVWYTGQIVGGIDASQARVLERFTIADDTHVWHRTELLDLTPTELAPVGVGDFHGDLFHYGDRLVVHEPNGETQTVARAPVVRTFNATDTLRPIFETLWLIFDRYLPILTSADDMEVPFDPSQRAEHHVDRPPFHAELDDSGMIHVRSNGTELNGHVTAWYTLASQLYCVIAGRPPECMHYPSVGRMLPDGQAVHKRVMRHHFDEFGALVRECGRRDLIEATEFFSHFLMGRVLFHYRSSYRDEEDPILRVIATFPPALMRESYFIPKHFEFESTTNLSVARFIVREGHLDSDDFRDRLDMCAVLHGTALATNKTSLFLKDVVPAVLNRFDQEPTAGVREMLGAVLEANIISAQVDAEVSQKYHYSALLPLIDFCIARGQNLRLNRARRVDTLWALGRDADARAEQSAWLGTFGEDSPLPGVYSNRHAYRRAELWFLRGRIDSAYQRTTAENHQKRLQALEEEYNRIRPDCDPAWPELQELGRDLSRYRDAAGAAGTAK